MPRYMLDTNICTDLMKQQPPETDSVMRWTN
jgi:predicted nucleic acid-binding protein